MSWPVQDRKALIIGCGVAGPVLALYLQRIGITPVVYEGRPEPRDEAGFFLNLAENGTDVLETLGIKEEVLKDGHQSDRLVFQNHKQKQLGETYSTHSPLGNEKSSRSPSNGDTTIIHEGVH